MSDDGSRGFAERLLADAALVATFTVSTAVGLDWLARHGIGSHAASEWLLLRLLGSPFPIMHRVVFFGQSWRLFPLLLATFLLLAWRPTRRITARIIVIIAAVWGAWIGAVASAALNAIEPSLGIVPAFASLVVAALLASRSRCLVTPMIIVAVALAFGTLIAQFVHALPLDSTSPWRYSLPVVGILVPLLIALFFSWLVWRRTAGQTMTPTRRFVRLWGLSVVCLSCVLVVAVEERKTVNRTPAPAGSRILPDRAYDVRVVGDPPQLVWTDRERIQVLNDPYGAAPRREVLDEENVALPERIWPAARGGIWIANAGRFAWWEVPPERKQIAYSPSAWVSFPEWVYGSGANLWTFAEDPVAKHVISISEYYSHYAVLERDTGKEVTRGILSSATWPFWHFNVDAAARIMYIVAALDDGGLYQFDLDSLRFERKARDLYLYETALDRPQHLLWGIRPLTGEVIAVDTRTFDIRHRIPTGFGLRDLQRDETTGDLYTCSFVFGDIYRIDAQTLTASNIGWCGLACRNLYLDAPNATLWAATRQGICRIPVPSSTASH